ncbi:hypothetical protein [Streptomyces sp. NPDC060035]|uniref:hypothetical protein n=1 Tax=Streptomyces sp. NPDC060035 TaxID=3347044 RepID=UPI0036A3EBB2
MHTVAAEFVDVVHVRSDDHPRSCTIQGGRCHHGADGVGVAVEVRLAERIDGLSRDRFCNGQHFKGDTCHRKRSVRTFECQASITVGSLTATSFEANNVLRAAGALEPRAAPFDRGTF